MAIKYKWLAAKLREQLPDYAARGQHQLPTEAELASRYKVSRQTVRQALAQLTQEGLIEKRQGSGSFLTGRLRSFDQNIVSILISSDSDYTYPTFLYHLRQELQRKNFMLRVHITDNDIAKERSILSELLSDPPRVLIVEPVKSTLPNPNLDLYRTLLRNQCHIVFLRHSYPQLNKIDCVGEDNLSGSRMLTEHLLAQGHTSLGALFYADDLSGSERYQGMIESLRDNGLPLPDASVRWFHTFELQQLIQKRDTDFIKKAIQESFSSCTAILCHNDLIAYELIRALHMSSDPRLSEITVVSFDHSYLCRASQPSFLSLSHREHELEQKLTETALAPLKGLPANSSNLDWIFQP